MKKYLIPRITTTVSHNNRGKSAELVFNKDLYKTNPDKVNDEIIGAISFTKQERLIDLLKCIQVSLRG